MSLEDNEVSAAWTMDEGRFGLKSWFRRRWYPLGERPPWIVEDRYEWRWLYAAVEPVTGRCFFMVYTHIDGACFQSFLDELAKEVRGETVGLVLDSSGSHTSKKIAWPEEIKPLPLPAYSPELAPAEQIMKHFRDVLSNRLFEDVEELEQALLAEARALWDSPEVVVSMTAYPWWREGVAAISNIDKSK